MDDLSTRISHLQHLAELLLQLESEDAPLYSDEFSRLNEEVLGCCDALFGTQGSTAEEEGSLCLALLLGYNATIYDLGNKAQKKHALFQRGHAVLEKLPASLLKVRLLTYCYEEVYDEALLDEARSIIDTWDASSLTPQQKVAIKEWKLMEESSFWFEVVENE